MRRRMASQAAPSPRTAAAPSTSAVRGRRCTMCQSGRCSLSAQLGCRCRPGGSASLMCRANGAQGPAALSPPRRPDHCPGQRKRRPCFSLVSLAARPLPHFAFFSHARIAAAASGSSGRSSRRLGGRAGELHAGSESIRSTVATISVVAAHVGRNSPTPSVCASNSGRATNSTLTPGCWTRAIRASATP